MRMSVLLWPPFPHLEVSAGGDRDTALDVVRSWSLFVVVFGHFIMQILLWEDQVPLSGNTLSSGGPWPYVTWILQVMPLFFIAGGAVNIGSYERSGSNYSNWLWQRTRRLMKPTVIFLLVMATAFSVISLVVPQPVTDALVSGVTGPLWFLAVYIVITALTPLTSALWKRSHLKSIAGLLALAIAIDFLRLEVAEALGVFNLVIAWVLVHQLGYWYRDGISRTQAKVLVVTGLSVNVMVTQILGWYPTSLVGIPTEKFSNMAPPTIVLVMHSFVLCGLFVLLAPTLRALVQKPHVAKATARAAMLAMTVYLWHMSVLVAWLSVLHSLGWDLPARLENEIVVPDGLNYWGWLVPSTLVFAAVLYALVRYLWPLEFMRISWFDHDGEHEKDSISRTIVSSALISLGLLGIAGAGFSGFPFAIQESFGIPLSTAGCLIAVLIGIALLRPSKVQVPPSMAE